MGTGIAIHIRDKRYVGLVFMRSGIAAKHGIRLSNGVGVIDSDYQGEIILSLHNTGVKPFHIDVGDRLAQLLFVPVAIPKLVEVDQFTFQTDRGSGGFGSTDQERQQELPLALRPKLPPAEPITVIVNGKEYEFPPEHFDSSTKRFLTYDELIDMSPYRDRTAYEVTNVEVHKAKESTVLQPLFSTEMENRMSVVVEADSVPD